MSRSTRMQLTMEVWVHSHHDTGEPIDWEVLSVSGKDIPTDLLLYLVSPEHHSERLDDLSDLKKIEPETVARIRVVMELETAPGGGWYIDRVLNVNGDPVEP